MLAKRKPIGRNSSGSRRSSWRASIILGKPTGITLARLLHLLKFVDIESGVLGSLNKDAEDRSVAGRSLGAYWLLLAGTFWLLRSVKGTESPESRCLVLTQDEG